MPADAPRLTRLPADLLARTPAEGARLVALVLATEAAEARARLTDPANGRTADGRMGDAEALHDFRVAVRRLRSTLGAYRDALRGSVGKREAKRLRTAARATNAGRDLEVQLAWLDVQRGRMYSRQRPGALWLRARLVAAKREADATAARAVGKKVERALAALARALPAYTVHARVALPGDPPSAAPRFAAVLAARLRGGAAALGAGLTAAAAARAADAASEAAVEQAHEARLAAKRVRYLLAPVAKRVEGAGPVLVQLKELQDQLGELHDLDVLAGVLARARDDAAAEAEAAETERAEAARADAERADAERAETDHRAAGPAVVGLSAGGDAPVLDARPNGASDASPTAGPGPAPGTAPHASSDEPPPDVPASAAPVPAAPDVRPGLVALARRAAARRTALDAEVAATWLAGGGAGLVAALDALAAEIEAAHQGPGVEVERKYLLRALPRVLRGAASADVDQGWLPGERLRERVRRVRDAGGERFVRTVKLGSGVARIEVEEACTRELFDALWPLTRERRVRKRRYRVPDGALVWEVDEFTDRALVLAEIELPAADVEVAIPSWLAPYLVREVTDEGEYVNANLARPADGAALGSPTSGSQTLGSPTG